MDPHAIAGVPNAVIVDKTDSEHPGYSLRLVNLELGVRLRLEVPVSLDEVRLFVERFRRNGPSFIGAVTIHDVGSVVAQDDEVRFIGERSELSVKRSGVFVVPSL